MWGCSAPGACPPESTRMTLPTSPSWSHLNLALDADRDTLAEVLGAWQTNPPVWP